MKSKLLTPTDVTAFAEIAGLQNWRSIASLLSIYADTECPTDEDFHVVIAKELLPDSYKNNPSLLSSVILSKSEFLDSSGHRTPDAPNTVTIQLLRERKPSYQRWTRITPTLKGLIKDWLNLNLPKEKKLRIPINAITAFYRSHPEQLKYQIKAETDTPISILQLSKVWLITRK